MGTILENPVFKHKKIIEKAQEKLPKEFCKIVEKMYNNKEKSIDL